MEWVFEEGFATWQFRGQDCCLEDGAANTVYDLVLTNQSIRPSKSIDIVRRKEKVNSLSYKSEPISEI